MRTLLTLSGLTTVIVLVFIVIGFIRGLEHSLTASGDPQVALLFSLGMGENLEYSSIPMRSSELVAASVAGIKEFKDRKYVSPELYLGTQIELPEQSHTVCPPGSQTGRTGIRWLACSGRSADRHTRRHQTGIH